MKSDQESKGMEIVLLTWKETTKVMEKIVGSEKSDDLGGTIGKCLFATALDVAGSGLLGPEAKAIAKLVGSIFETAQSDGEEILENIQELKQMEQTIIKLNKQVLQQLSVIESKLDKLSELVQWTYALGNTHPYATFIEEAVEHWMSASQFDQKDGSLSPEQKKLADDFTIVTADGLENQLQLFYEGVVGKDITGSDEDLGLLTLYIKQSWEKIAESDLHAWYNNAAIFISKVKSLLLRGVHAMLWAVMVTNPNDIERYRNKYSAWLKTIDDQLLRLVPAVMHQLIFNGTNYNFHIRHVPIKGGLNHPNPVCVTDPFTEGSDTLQRIVFQSNPKIDASGNSMSEWQTPPKPDLLPEFGYGTLHDVKKRNQFNVMWDIDKFTLMILKAETGKLGDNEPVMKMGTMRSTYKIVAYPHDYTFTQDDAVLTTDRGIEFKLRAMDWDNRSSWYLINNDTDQYLATADVHGTGGVMSFDFSTYTPRFSASAGDNFTFASRWNFINVSD